MSRSPELLDAAAAVFLRYGFRKTSMDEVARAAQISRQGLYLHYETKEALFHAAFEHFLKRGVEDAKASLDDDSRSTEERLVGAFDAWIGRFIGMFGEDATDLLEASQRLKALYFEYEGRFDDAVAKALRAGDVMVRHRAAGLSAKQVAEVMNATARGYKHRSATRDSFAVAMRTAVRALCGGREK